jgi:hypothetical protein
MRKMIVALAGVAFVMAAAPAAAQTVVAGSTTVQTTPVDGNASAFTIGFTDCCMVTNFSEQLTFTSSLAGFLSVTGSTSTNVNGGPNDVDFSSIFLTGTGISSPINIPFTFNNDLIEQFGRSGIGILPGTFTVTFNGTAAGANGSFGGNVSFVQGAIPEPGTWAMMLLGFGMVGVATRRRRRKALLPQIA